MIMHLSAAIQGIDPGELPGSFDWWSQSEHVYQIKCFQLCETSIRRVFLQSLNNEVLGLGVAL